MNNYVCMGRLVNEPTIKELDDGKKVSNITLAVTRSYKNENGEYDTDFIDCELWNGVCQNVSEYCKKGDIIGIKGSVKSRIYEKEDGSKQKEMYVAVEKVSFLAAKSKTKDVNMSEVEPEMA